MLEHRISKNMWYWVEFGVSLQTEGYMVISFAMQLVPLLFRTTIVIEMYLSLFRNQLPQSFSQLGNGTLWAVTGTLQYLRHRFYVAKSSPTTQQLLWRKSERYSRRNGSVFVICIVAALFVANYKDHDDITVNCDIVFLQALVMGYHGLRNVRCALFCAAIRTPCRQLWQRMRPASWRTRKDQRLWL